MNRYMLGLFVVLSFGVSYLSASKVDFAAVEISYTYCNDEVSRAAGLVPIRRHCNADDLVHTAQFNAYFYGTSRSPGEILSAVINQFELNEFSKLRLKWQGKEIVSKQPFTMEMLCRVNRFTIDYDVKANTPDAIKYRRIQWMVDQIAGAHEQAWRNRAIRERVQLFVEQNYVHKTDKCRSVSELRKMAREQKIIE